MAKIAITGAAGTIGAPLCADLARDHDIVRIDLHDADVIADVQDVDALERPGSAGPLAGGPRSGRAVAAGPAAG